jgi:DNA-binding GntR family transcriptional regulator
VSSKTGRVAKVGYKQVAEALIERIRSGEFASRDMLPTEEKLQREYGVSRTTVRRALAGVVESGFGMTVPNKGIMAEPQQSASNSVQTIGFIGGRPLVGPNLVEKDGDGGEEAFSKWSRGN